MIEVLDSARGPEALMESAHTAYVQELRKRVEKWVLSGTTRSELGDHTLEELFHDFPTYVIGLEVRLDKSAMHSPNFDVNSFTRKTWLRVSQYTTRASN